MLHMGIGVCRFVRMHGLGLELCFLSRLITPIVFYVRRKDCIDRAHTRFFLGQDRAFSFLFCISVRDQRMPSFASGGLF